MSWMRIVPGSSEPADLVGHFTGRPGAKERERRLESGTKWQSGSLLAAFGAELAAFQPCATQS